jgi:hypothetical protein
MSGEDRMLGHLVGADQTHEALGEARPIKAFFI